MRLILFFLFLLSLSIITSKKNLRQFHKGFYQTWQDFYDSDRDPKIDVSLIQNCEQNDLWEQEIGHLLKSPLLLPESPSIIPPNRCPNIFLYTLNENRINYYLNFCLRKKKLLVQQNLRIVASQGVKLDNLVKYANNLKNELTFTSSLSCNSKKTKIDKASFLTTIRCSGYPTVSIMQGKTHIKTNSFLSTSISTECNPTYFRAGVSNRFIFMTPGESISRYGREITYLSSHPDEAEFLLVPGVCYKVDGIEAQVGLETKTYILTASECAKDVSKIIEL